MAPAKPPDPKAPRLICHNRRARHDYAFDSELEAGVVLTGTEVKSCRAGHAHLNDAYVQVRGAEAFLVHGHIAEYNFGNRHNHAPGRERKLLMHRRQIDVLGRQLRQDGLSAIPLSLGFVRGRVKCVIGVGRGKKAVDKRHALKARQSAREAQREIAEARGAPRRGGPGRDE